ncbi:MAG: hydrogenase, partial [Kiritimatiellae bacterium]|nr:hydrogenase [Kiritimatiellia bacterium]
GSGLKLTKGNFIEADPVTGKTSINWVFAGGDVVSGPASVIEAVGAGERAAVGIDKYLTGSEHAFWRQELPVDTFFDPDAEPVAYTRAEIELVPVEKRKNFNEVELVWNEKTATCEAKRCLRCDYRGSCD